MAQRSLDKKYLKDGHESTKFGRRLSAKHVRNTIVGALPFENHVAQGHQRVSKKPWLLQAKNRWPGHGWLHDQYADWKTMQRYATETGAQQALLAKKKQRFYDDLAFRVVKEGA